MYFRPTSVRSGSYHLNPRLPTRPLHVQHSRLQRPLRAPNCTPSDITKPEKNTPSPQDEDANEILAVNIAITSNLVIFAAKVFVSNTSGSSALLAEAVHSLADIGNQLLLRLGIAKAAKKPTAEYPYGYLKDKFVFSLISATGVFCVGAGASLINGINALGDVDHDVGNFDMGFKVLAMSFIVEGFSFAVAVNTVQKGARAEDISMSEYLNSGRNPGAVAVMAEDGAAVLGILIAAASTALVQITDWQAWDGLGSILVGILLACVALFLIQRNRSVLIGRSMSASDYNLVIGYLLSDPTVNTVYDAKSEEIGPGVYRFGAEIDFNGDIIAKRHMTTIDNQALFHKFQNTTNPSNLNDTRSFNIVLQEYSAELVRAVALEVDRMERQIKILVPGVQYVDLEADRGRFSQYKVTVDDANLPQRPYFDMSQLSVDDVSWDNEVDRILFDSLDHGSDEYETDRILADLEARSSASTQSAAIAARAARQRKVLENPTDQKVLKRLKEANEARSAASEAAGGALRDLWAPDVARGPATVGRVRSKPPESSIGGDDADSVGSGDQGDRRKNGQGP